jgi:hypothetical protein
MAAGFTDTDKGMEKIRREMEKLKSMSVKAGIVEGAGEVDGVAVAQYAAWNEMGVPGVKKKWKIPPRPFIRGWIDNKRASIQKTVEKLFGLVSNGSLDANTAVGRLGQYAQDGIKTYIKTGDFVANAEITILRKGSSRPLIDSGTMRNSVRYEILNKPAGEVTSK